MGSCTLRTVGRTRLVSSDLLVCVVEERLRLRCNYVREVDFLLCCNFRSPLFPVIIESLRNAIVPLGVSVRDNDVDS